MTMTVGLTVSKIGRGPKSNESRHDEIDCNSLKCNLGLYVVLNLNIILNGLSCNGGGFSSMSASISCYFMRQLCVFL